MTPLNFGLEGGQRIDFYHDFLAFFMFHFRKTCYSERAEILFWKLNSLLKMSLAKFHYL